MAGPGAVPLFDSCTHPSLDGSYLPGKTLDNSIAGLERAAKRAHVRWAFALALGTDAGWDFASYPERLAAHPWLFPAAFVDFRRLPDRGAVERQIRAAAERGYRGIKIHPRLSEITLDDPRVRRAVESAEERGLLSFVCSYLSVDWLAELLRVTDGARLVLLHGGGARLLETMELARAHSRVLLDLSYTLTRYAGSSLDQDLSFLFRTFDQRICVGSDSPENSVADLRRRFDRFARGLSRDKQENVAWRNLAALAGLTIDAGDKGRRPARRK